MPRTLFDRPDEKVRLDELSAEPPKGMTREKAEPRLAELGEELFALQDEMFASKASSVLVVLQGRDTAGKDGTIKHVAGYLNPRGVSVVSFGVPTAEEREHDFLWRVHRHAPRLGEFAIFNRSHYEDVVAVRMYEIAPEPVWRPRYTHIRDFERMLVDEGTTVLKAFLNVSRDEQRARLQERVDDPGKRWKFRRDDLKVRERFDDWVAAWEEAVTETSTDWAPWHIVPADRNWVKALAVAELVAGALERLDPQPPDPEEGIEGMQIR